jgi:hypothetical protein
MAARERKPTGAPERPESSSGTPASSSDPRERRQDKTQHVQPDPLDEESLDRVLHDCPL